MQGGFQAGGFPLPTSPGTWHYFAMINRRRMIAAATAGVVTLNTAGSVVALAAGNSFTEFVAGVRTEAHRSGISVVTLDRAFQGVTVNQKVLDRDRNQPEFTMTWQRYRNIVLNDQRIASGREAWRQNRDLLARVQARYGVDPHVLLGIWGLESSFGTQTGGFHVIEALATLAFDGRRASFFRGELMAALKILEAGDITPARMTGSYAGAMGQPQFMPTSYLKLAVDFDGHGRRDIWTDKADVLGSIANYLARSGWRAGEAWGGPATVPPGFDSGKAGRENRRSLTEWTRLGVRPAEGAWPGLESNGRNGLLALLWMDGTDGEAFLIGPNFSAIRRYNPSDFYGVGVGLLGDKVAG